MPCKCRFVLFSCPLDRGDLIIRFNRYVSVSSIVVACRDQVHTSNLRDVTKKFGIVPCAVDEGSVSKNDRISTLAFLNNVYDLPRTVSSDHI